MNQFIWLWYWYYEISPRVKIQSFPVFSLCHLGASLLQIVADLCSYCPPYLLSRPRSLHDLRHVDLALSDPVNHVQEVNPCRLTCKKIWVDWTGIGWIRVALRSSLWGLKLANPSKNAVVVTEFRFYTPWGGGGRIWPTGWILRRSDERTGEVDNINSFIKYTEKKSTSAYLVHPAKNECLKVARPTDWNTS